MDTDDDDDFVDPPPRSTVSVSSIVKGFNPEKKKLVSDMVLGGMLELSDIDNDRKFVFAGSCNCRGRFMESRDVPEPIYRSKNTV